MLESLLADFDKFLGLKAIQGKAERAGHFLLRISSEDEVWIRDLHPGVFLQSTITSIVKAGQREELYMYLMRANFLGQGTGGSIIGLDPNEKYLTLSLPIRYEVNYRTLRDKLEEFLNYLEYWRNEIRDYERKHN